MTDRGRGPAMRVLVVVPDDGRAATPGFLDELAVSGPAHDVLLVAVGARPGARERLRERAASDPGRVHVLSSPRPEGLGRAYRAGFAWALVHDYDVIVQAQPPVGCPVERLPALVAATRDADVVLCSSAAPGGEGGQPSVHRLHLSRLGGGTARRTGLRLSDLATGFRAWRASALAALDLDTLPAGGSAFQIEAILAALRRGARVARLPATDGRPAASAVSLRREAVVALARARARARDSGLGVTAARRARVRQDGRLPPHGGITRRP